MVKYKVPARVLRELERTGLPYSFERGGQHTKMRLDGRFIGILPRNGGNESYGQKWAAANSISQIRRMARRIKEEQACPQTS